MNYTKNRNLLIALKEQKNSEKAIMLNFKYLSLLDKTVILTMDF